MKLQDELRELAHYLVDQGAYRMQSGEAKIAMVRRAADKLAAVERVIDNLSEYAADRRKPEAARLAAHAAVSQLRAALESASPLRSRGPDNTANVSGLVYGDSDTLVIGEPGSGDQATEPADPDLTWCNHHGRHCNPRDCAWATPHCMTDGTGRAPAPGEAHASVRLDGETCVVDGGESVSAGKVERCIGPAPEPGTCILAKGHRGLCVPCLDCNGTRRVRGADGYWADCEACVKRGDVPSAARERES